MGKFIDLTGMRFGRLKVCRRYPKPSNHIRQGVIWICKCDCGRGKLVRSSHLLDGSVVSCGCVRSEHGKELIKRILEKRSNING